MNTEGFIDISEDMFFRGLIFLLFALIGVVTHAVKKWLRGDIQSISEWFTGSPRNTVGAMLGVFGASFTTALSHQLDGLTLTQLIMLSYPIGYSVDSLLNKSERKEELSEEK